MWNSQTMFSLREHLKVVEGFTRHAEIMFARLTFPQGEFNPLTACGFGKRQWRILHSKVLFSLLDCCTGLVCLLFIRLIFC
ncbi:hypothetical protein EJB05_18484 [Eragrostis curvula]|uniref:Uncharacterized protein n=1 Tax=Eragrostis curvula TaxID=38414 RepID=A0A5J9VLT1_9POAL|nr:hypothetical protein EJB05_18484 [Eragrostis curvula]